MSHRFMFILSWTQLNRSVQAGLMWKFRSDFPSCSEFAEICHVDSFCVKNVPVFFSRTQKNMDKTVWKSPPPPSLSLSVSKQPRISILESQIIVRVCFTLLEGEGGGLSRMCLKPCFPACGKKNTGHLFTEKESTWQISMDSEQLGKSL